MDYYISHRQIQSRFEEILSDKTVFDRRKVTEYISSKVDELLSCKSLPDDYSLILENVANSSLLYKTKMLLHDLILGLFIVDLSNSPAKSAVKIFKHLDELNDNSFGKNSFYEMAWNKLDQDLLNCETLPEIIDCASVFIQLDEEKQDMFAKLLSLQLSHVIGMKNENLIENATYIMYLKEIPTAALKYSQNIIQYTIQSVFEIISNSENYRLFGITDAIIDDNKIKEALLLISDYPLQDEYLEEYKRLITNFRIDLHDAENVQSSYLSIQSDESTLNDIVIQNNAENIIRGLIITSMEQLNKIEDNGSFPKPNYGGHPGYLETGLYKVKSDNMKVFVKLHYCHVKYENLAKQAYYMATMQNHGNFLRVYGSFWEYGVFNLQTKGTYQYRYILVMEPANMNLNEKIRRLEANQETSEYKQEYAYQCARQLIPAFYDLNVAGIAHRDIKPGNILVMENDQTLKIIDFDISEKSKKKSDFASETVLAMKGYGTLGYMAPELLRIPKEGRKIQYNKCDVYSLGLTIFRIVTERNEGALNVNNDDLQDIVDRAIERYIQHIELKELLKQMLVVDPEKRLRFGALTSLINNIMTG